MMRYTLDERDNDITDLLEEMESLRATIEELTLKVKDKDAVIDKHLDEIKGKDIEMNLLLNTIDNKNDTIQMLMSTSTGNTINNTNITNNTVNNTIVLNQYFSADMIDENKRMTIEQALGGLKGVAEYISIQTVVSPERGIRSYYVTDASRSNGIFLNKDGQWIRDEGGEMFQTVFRKIAFELRKSIVDYRDGKMDDEIDEDNIPGEIVADMRRTRENLMNSTRQTLLCPDAGSVKKIMKGYKGVAGDFREIKDMDIKIEIIQ